MGQGEGSGLRYDAAIIGAGAEGLAAATILAQTGLCVLVIERNARPGGRCITREFHPGFRASPFCDEVAPIPAELCWAFDLARRGAVFAPRRESLALWPDRYHVLESRSGDNAASRLLGLASYRRAEIASRVLSEASAATSRAFIRKSHPRPWPGGDWASAALAEIVAPAGEESAAHLAALALSRRIADPALAGSALHLLGMDEAGGGLSGGLETLGTALISAAQSAGVEFALGLEASDVRRKDGHIVAVGLSDGTEIETRSVISTLDLKRTFLTFFPWNTLPKPLVQHVSAFRFAGAAARVLFALDSAPEFAVAVRGAVPIHVAPDLGQIAQTYYAWRAGILADRPPVTLRVVSSGDPLLAPQSGAVVTATLSGIPHRLFDGGWTHEKREALRTRALDAAEQVSPGFASRVVGCEVIAPSDIEDALGATEGDLDGGEIASDQMMGFAPWDKPAMPRTPVAGLYLAGSNLTASAFATCVAGAAAARALLADLAQGRFK
jgi:phytoene dehydrogenase-like protein